MKPEIKAALDRWAREAILPGNFLQAVLRGELFKAVFRADEENLRDLLEICRYVYNVLPGSCWGNPIAMRRWEERDPDARRKVADSCADRNLENGG